MSPLNITSLPAFHRTCRLSNTSTHRGYVDCLLFFVSLITLLVFTTQASADEAEQARWDQLTELTKNVEPIKTYRANFTQQKFDPVLRDPLESTGQVRIAGGLSRWDTHKPYASTMLVADGELRLHYPDQKSLEVYELGDRLDAMAGSPVPDIHVLQEHFTLESLTPDGDTLSLTLVPKTDEMKEALQEVVVGLDTERGCLTKLEMTDLDDATTAMVFQDIELNPEIDPADLAIEVPKGTKITHPLGANGG